MDYLVNEKKKESVVLVGLYGSKTPRFKAEEYLDELEMLVQTAGGTTIEKFIQNKETPDVTTYIGKGKLSELTGYIKSNKIDIVVFDDDLSPTQVRNIERSTKAKVMDRSGIILDIFASRAKTAAAKTQVELAQLQYMLPRLTRMWTHLSKQKGGIGTKGPGETQIETDRRIIGKRISTLKDKIEKLDKQRVTQRKGRNEHMRVALVGYTNVGKSSIMNAITETDVLAENKLFATLDATIRRLETQNTTVLLSDTVGFIRKLPHHLITSFKSTLDEIRESDVLLHVMDASNLGVHEYKKIVEQTLQSIEVLDKPIVEVFNKIDKVSTPERLAELKRDYPNAIFVSAHNGIGLEQLVNKIEEYSISDYKKQEMKISLENFKAISFVFDNAEVLYKKYFDTYIEIEFLIKKAKLAQLEKLLTKSVDSTGVLT